MGRDHGLDGELVERMVGQEGLDGLEDGGLDGGPMVTCLGVLAAGGRNLEGYPFVTLRHTDCNTFCNSDSPPGFLPLMPETDPADLDDRVLSASIRVFASEPTSRVTLKRIALEAGVRAEQVTDRWSSTTELLTAAVDRLTEDLLGSGRGVRATQGGQLTERQEALLDQAVHLSRALLCSTRSTPTLPGPVPHVRQRIAHFVSQGDDLRTARYRAFQLMVVEFGARLFGSSLPVACGLQDESPAQVRAAIDSLQGSGRPSARQEHRPTRWPDPQGV